MSSLEGIDKDKDEEIIADMEKIKKSPHIFAIEKTINKESVEQEIKLDDQSAKKEEIKSEKKEEKRQTNINPFEKALSVAKI